MKTTVTHKLSRNDLERAIRNYLLVAYGIKMPPVFNVEITKELFDTDSFGTYLKTITGLKVTYEGLKK